MWLFSLPVSQGTYYLQEQLNCQEPWTYFKNSRSPSQRQFPIACICQSIPVCRASEVSHWSELETVIRRFKIVSWRFANPCLSHVGKDLCFFLRLSYSSWLSFKQYLMRVSVHSFSQSSQIICVVLHSQYWLFLVVPNDSSSSENIVVLQFP